MVAASFDRDLCAPFVESLPVTGASISVFGESGSQSAVGASDETASRLESMQFDLAEGPHWESLRTQERVLVGDLNTEGRDAWPIFAAAALELGVAALFAFPMRLGAALVGVVDLYRVSPGSLSSAEIDRAEALTQRAAALAVRAALRSAEDGAPDEDARAPAMRREVHQAIGMILAQLDISATEAFSRLRAHAFATDRTVSEVANDVVKRTIDFSLLRD